MSFFFPHNRTISPRLMNKLRIQNTMKNGLNRYSRKSFPSVQTKSLRNGWNILPPNQNRVLKPTFYKIFSNINYCSPGRFEYNKIHYLKFISTNFVFQLRKTYYYWYGYNFRTTYQVTIEMLSYVSY